MAATGVPESKAAWRFASRRTPKPGGISTIPVHGDEVFVLFASFCELLRSHLFQAQSWNKPAKQLAEFGAKSITLPAITPTTLLAIEKAEASAKRGLSFAELSRIEAGHLERLLAGEIQWAMGRMFRQYHAIADLLLPSAFIPTACPAVAEAATATPELQLNFGE